MRRGHGAGWRAHAGPGPNDGDEPVQILSGILTLLSVCLAGVIGGRLLARSERGAAERWLAGYFLLAGFAGTLVTVTLYSSWADPSLRLPDALAVPLMAVGLTFGYTGAACLGVFTWRTFRPGSPWAGAAAVAVAALLATGFAVQAAGPGFAIVVWPDAGYWLAYAARLVPFLWLAVESLSQARQARRRMRLGLTEPLLANRFVLLSVWASAAFALAFVDIGARIAYVRMSGETVEWIPSVGQPIVEVAVAASTAGQSVAVLVLFLTFFPTAAYRRRVEAWAARSRASSS